MRTFDPVKGDDMVRILLGALFACADTGVHARGTEARAAAADDAPEREHVAAARAPVQFAPLVGEVWTFPERRGPLPEVDTRPCGANLYDGTVHTAELTLDDAALDDLAVAPHLPTVGALAWDGAPTLLVGLHLKGNASLRTLDGKPSFKIDVHDWFRAQRLDGCKRLTLNNMIQDPSMLREHAYYAMAHHLGRVAPRQAWVDVRVNGAPYGRYSLVETLDEQFVARNWPDDAGGNLYEASGADFTPENDWLRLEESGGEAASPSDLHALVTRLAAAPAGEFLAAVDRSFDRDELLDFLALDIVAGNDDGYVFNHHNYFVYHAPREDRWTLVPWGTDRSFTRPVPPQGDVATPTIGTLALRCWADPACAPLLQQRIDALAGELHDWLAPELREHTEAIGAACAADPRREFRCNTAGLLDFVAGRRDTLQVGLPTDTGP